MIRRQRGGRRAVSRFRAQSKLKLTSMMDILTVLLLFLLKSFVVEGEAMVPPAGLELPESSAESSPQISLVVAINDDAILVGDEVVASVSASLEDPSPVIEPLAVYFDETWEKLDNIARLKGEAQAEARTVTIQGDREIEFRILEKVMVTLAESGFEDVSLAVIRKART